MKADMRTIKKLCKDYIHNEDGATAMEYGLLVALLSVALIAAYSVIAQNSDSLWNTVSSDFSGA